jgi:hypothetical protein
MSDSHKERTESAVEDFKKQLEEVRSTAEAEREKAEDQVETEEEYRQRIANVPGIFGDIDTTAGVSASGTDVISAQNEIATQTAAEVEGKADEGDEEAQDQSYDEARRQADVAGPQPSAEQVDERASDASDEEREENPGGTQEDVKAQAEQQSGNNTAASDSLEGENDKGKNELASEDDDAKKETEAKANRRGRKSS